MVFVLFVHIILGSIKVLDSMENASTIGNSKSSTEFEAMATIGYYYTIALGSLCEWTTRSLPPLKERTYSTGSGN